MKPTIYTDARTHRAIAADVRLAIAQRLFTAIETMRAREYIEGLEKEANRLHRLEMGAEPDA